MQNQGDDAASAEPTSHKRIKLKKYTLTRINIQRVRKTEAIIEQEHGIYDQKVEADKELDHIQKYLDRGYQYINFKWSYKEHKHQHMKVVEDCRIAKNSED